MARELRELWRIRCPHLQDKIIVSAEYAESERARLDAGGWNPTIERLPLLTPEAAAVVEAAVDYESAMKVYDSTPYTIATAHDLHISGIRMLGAVRALHAARKGGAL